MSRNEPWEGILRDADAVLFLRPAVGFVLLPLRLFAYGTGLLAAAFSEMGGRLETAPVASSRGAPQGTIDNFRPASVPPDAARQAAAGPSPATPPAASSREVGMAYDSRDTDLSGDELKVVEYSIVTVKADMDDSDRILVGPKTTTVSSDMRPEDFATWVVAQYFQGEHDPIEHKDKKYLRVCFRVLCRMVLDKDEEVDVLRDIQKTLKKGFEGGSAMPNQAREGAGGGSSSGGSGGIGGSASSGGDPIEEAKRSS